MKDSVLSILEGALKDGETTIKVKSLRKMVLLSLQQDDGEKAAKKEYKKAIQELESEGKLALDSDGLISLSKGKDKNSKKRRRKDADGEKSSKSKRKSTDSVDDEAEDAELSPTHENGEDAPDPYEANVETMSKNKNVPCKGNPQGVTRLFVGNLPFAVDETALKAFLPGLTHVKWITDKETGAFYGSSFIEMEDSSKAADAVAKAGSQLMGRPVKINFAPSRPGDVWPPTNTKKSASAGGGQAGGSGVKAMSAKPDDCKKLFIGNLSYEIDDDEITKFFASVEAEVKAVRWLHHKDSGDFKGCGYVEFWKSEDCSKGATLNGKTLLGRPIRIDWSD